MMQTIFYFLLLPFLYLISFLPFPLLYRLSDALYYLLYYIIGYRRRVVSENLKKSFPGKPEEELKKIRQLFYRNFSDVILEIIKMLTMSRDEISSRCSFSTGSYEIFDGMYNRNKNVIIAMGHCGNWEWAGLSKTLRVSHPFFVVYHRLYHSRFDRLMLKLRSKFGAIPVDMNGIYRKLAEPRDGLTTSAFIADQSPPPESAFWIKFLNRDTPFFPGPEKIARKLGYPVVFANVKRKKRGYYEMVIELLCENAASAAEGDITRAYAAKLEAAVIAQPGNWLWSHRRWKHAPPQKLQSAT